jgi:hypothetical protein
MMWSAGLGCIDKTEVVQGLDIVVIERVTRGVCRRREAVGGADALQRGCSLSTRSPSIGKVRWSEASRRVVEKSRTLGHGTRSQAREQRLLRRVYGRGCARLGRCTDAGL